jgi:hypothetical protein
MAVQIDRQARMALIVRPRYQHDLVNQLADQVRRLAHAPVHRPVQALMDGVPGSRVKDKMADLESRKAETEARIKDATDNPALIHPNMANYYRDQIAALREAAPAGPARVRSSRARPYPSYAAHCLRRAAGSCAAACTLCRIHHTAPASPTESTRTGEVFAAISKRTASGSQVNEQCS